MNKKCFGLIVVPLLLVASPVLAADSISASPSSVVSGSEGSVSITATSNQGYWQPWLFSSTGTPMIAIATSSYANGSQSWTSVSFPTGLGVGSYYIAALENNGSCLGGGCPTNSYCSVGSGSRSSCMSTYGSQYFETTFSVVSGSSTPSSTFNSSTFFNWATINFVHTTEQDSISSTGTVTSIVVTQSYNPMDMYWVLLTGLIVLFAGTYCVYKWIKN